MRTFVGAVGAFIILAGLAEIVLPRWTISMARGLYSIDALLIIGFLAMAIGMELIAAAVTRRVGLMMFVEVIGAIFALFGLVCAISPGVISEFGQAILLHQAWGSQLVLLWTTGIIRILLGMGLLYAALRPPAVTVPAH